MNSTELQKLVDHLFTHVTDHKRETIPVIVAQRTDYLTLVLEDISQSHNSSAVLRTAESLGLTDIWLVEQNYRYQKTETIDKGSSQWLNLHRYATPEPCLLELKKQGYTLVATSPHAQQGITLEKLPIDHKIALIFGTERTGISQAVQKQADFFITIPMYGFTESYNISVAAGICLYTLSQKIRSSGEIDWKLPQDKSNMITLAWLRRLVSGSGEIERRFLLEIRKNC